MATTEKHITIQCHQPTECAWVIDNPIIIYLFLVCFVLTRRLSGPPPILSSSLSNQHKPIESRNKSLRCQKAVLHQWPPICIARCRNHSIPFFLCSFIASVIDYDKINASRLMKWIGSIFQCIWMQTRLFFEKQCKTHETFTTAYWWMRSPFVAGMFASIFEIALFISCDLTFLICMAIAKCKDINSL